MPERNNHHYDVLKDSKLFEGVEMEDIPDVLSCLQAQERCYKKGETILHFGDSIRLAGIVLSGKAKVSFYDETITPITVKFLMPGDTFGQVAACETDFKSPIELTAVFDSRIFLLDLYPILHGDKTSCHFYSKAYIHGLDSAALDDVFELLAWNQGIGYFSSEIGPSTLFAAYKTIKNMEKQGKERSEICETLKEKFGEKNPDVKV